MCTCPWTTGCKKSHCPHQFGLKIYIIINVYKYKLRVLEIILCSLDILRSGFFTCPGTSQQKKITCPKQHMYDSDNTAIDFATPVCIYYIKLLYNRTYLHIFKDLFFLFFFNNLTFVLELGDGEDLEECRHAVDTHTQKLNQL